MTVPIYGQTLETIDDQGARIDPVDHRTFFLNDKCNVPPLETCQKGADHKYCHTDSFLFLNRSFDKDSDHLSDRQCRKAADPSPQKDKSCILSEILVIDKYTSTGHDSYDNAV